MLIMAVHQTPSLTQERYEEVVRRLTNGKRRLESTSDLPFDGLVVHVTGQGKNGFCVVDVFASEEAVEAFNAAMASIPREVGIEQPPDFFPVHTFIREQLGLPGVTVKVPPGGTRGLRLPRFLARFGNGMMLRSFRKGGARTQGGIETLLLETVGGKTGRVRQSILGSFPDGDDAWLVIASLAGAARNPAWLHNLAARPEATVQLPDGRRIDVRAETLEGDDLAAAWERLEQEGPEYPKYRTKTDREVAIVRLRTR